MSLMGALVKWSNLWPCLTCDISYAVVFKQISSALVIVECNFPWLQFATSCWLSIDFAYQKLAVKFANNDHVSAECCNCGKYISVAKWWWVCCNDFEDQSIYFFQLYCKFQWWLNLAISKRRLSVMSPRSDNMISLDFMSIWTAGLPNSPSLHFA